MNNLDGFNGNNFNSTASLTGSVKASATYDIYERFITQASQNCFGSDENDSYAIKQHSSYDLYSKDDKHHLAGNSISLTTIDAADASDHHIKRNKLPKSIYLLLGLLLVAILVIIINATGFLTSITDSSDVVPDNTDKLPTATFDTTNKEQTATASIEAAPSLATVKPEASIEAATNSTVSDNKIDAVRVQEAPKSSIESAATPVTPAPNTLANTREDSKAQSDVVSLEDFESEASSTLYRETTN